MNARLTMKGLAEDDRPREKLLTKGKASLSEAELIAILLGTGNRNQTAVQLAQHILASCDNDLNNLARLTIKELQKFNGIGEAKAVSIASALEIGRRRKNSTPTHPHIKSPEDAFHLLNAEFTDLTHEEFWVLFLKQNNSVIKKEMVSKGGVSGTLVDVRVIFRRALEEYASGIVVAHNHPSGNAKPSQYDLDLTEKIKKAGDVISIKLLDHIILAGDEFYSFSNEGLLQ